MPVRRRFGQLRQRIRHHSLVRVLRVYLRPTRGDDLIRLGNALAGWWVPTSVLQPGAIAYCAGAGEDISFDLELHARGMRVVCFDPTPRAIAHVEAHAPHDRFTFLPVGWWDRADALKFYAPSDPAHVSHSVVNLQRTSEYFTAEVQRPADLMRDLGDDHVDLIKMDIEGAEYAVIESILSEGPLPMVWCIEFDQPQPVRRVVEAVRRIEAAGYELRQVDAWNYTFCLASER